MSDVTADGFLLPQRFDAARLADSLGGPSACQIDDTSTFEVRFFDSFDWRLFQAGLAMLRIASPQGTLLRLKPLEEGKVEEVFGFEPMPAWPADLPSGDLKEKVVDLFEMRVLLQLVQVQVEVTELRVLNEDGKTVVRLQYLRMVCRAPHLDEPRTLWPRVRLLAVRGYESELQRLSAHFAEEQEWPRAPECLFSEAMAAIGREGGDYSSKLNVALHPEQMAVDALRKILRHLLDTLECNIEGTRADLDSEFLHDLRVATRRTRSALTQVKRVLPDAVVEDFKQRFAWVGQITGPTRDLDVFLLELPRYRASLPEAMAGDLDALEEHLHAMHRSEQGKLKRKLMSPEMKTLLADWHAMLEAEALPGEPGWFADLPISRVASKRIWRMYKRVLKAGRAVQFDGPPEQMHELRKDCKKLRYLIEFFRGLYPEKEVKRLVKSLKVLLDNLGDFQDLEVQADKLRDFARAFKNDDPRHLPTVMAIGALVADLLRHQQAAHVRFAECFAAFDASENREIYTRLFKETRRQAS